jgi:hypothetical protein
MATYSRGLLTDTNIEDSDEIMREFHTNYVDSNCIKIREFLLSLVLFFMVSAVVLGGVFIVFGMFPVGTYQCAKIYKQSLCNVQYSTTKREYAISNDFKTIYSSDLKYHNRTTAICYASDFYPDKLYLSVTDVVLYACTMQFAASIIIPYGIVICIALCVLIATICDGIYKYLTRGSFVESRLCRIICFIPPKITTA